MKELTSNMELIGVLTGQYGDYGLPPAQSSGLFLFLTLHCIYV
jgi:all-trans-retinol 13,14-reductase